MVAKIVEIEITDTLNSLAKPENYQAIWILAKFLGQPLGWLTYEARQLPITATGIARDLQENFAEQILTCSIKSLLDSENGLSEASRHSFSHLFNNHISRSSLLSGQSGQSGQSKKPPFSVLITQSKACGVLEPCLRALREQNYPSFELLIVEDSHDKISQETCDLADFYGARIVQAEDASPANAFIQAVRQARYELVALTGTAAITNSNWLGGLAIAFDAPDVGAVSGPHLPLEMENAAQVMAKNKFLRPTSFVRFQCCDQPFSYHPALFGTWLNAAFRKDFLVSNLAQLEIILTGWQPPLLLPLFYEALAEGYSFAYEPSAYIRERFDSDEQKVLELVQAEEAIRRQFFQAALKKYPQDYKTIQQWLIDPETLRADKAFLQNFWNKVKPYFQWLVASS